MADISLYENLVESPAPSEATRSEKGKSKAASKPNLDMERKRQMQDRYEFMLKDQGLAYRIDGMNQLTTVQASGMVHRNQKHIEAVGVSEEVMSFVFEHRAVKANCIKRGEKVAADYEHYFNTFEKQFAEQHEADLADKEQFDEHGNKMTDGMERFGSEMDMLQLLESNAGDEKATEFIQFTDNWLAKLQNSLTALQEEGEETLKQFVQEPNYIFSDQDASAFRSARCRPIRFLKWPEKSSNVQSGDPVQEMEVCEIGDPNLAMEEVATMSIPCARSRSFVEMCLARKEKSKLEKKAEQPAELEANEIVPLTFEFMDEPVLVIEEIDSSARCRPIEILSQRPIRNYGSAQMDITNDVFALLNYAPDTLEDQLEFHLEKMGLQFESDVDGDDEEKADKPKSRKRRSKT